MRWIQDALAEVRRPSLVSRENDGLAKIGRDFTADFRITAEQPIVTPEPTLKLI